MTERQGKTFTDTTLPEMIAFFNRLVLHSPIMIGGAECWVFKDRTLNSFTICYNSQDVPTVRCICSLDFNNSVHIDFIRTIDSLTAEVNMIVVWIVSKILAEANEQTDKLFSQKGKKTTASKSKTKNKTDAKEKPKRGAPSLTDEAWESRARIVSQIKQDSKSQNITLREACELVGTPFDTYKGWIRALKKRKGE